MPACLLLASEAPWFDALSAPRLREFFFKTKHLRDAPKNRQLFEQMSPRLQAETLWQVHKQWLSRVRFLVGMDPEFIAAVCMSLEAMILSPDDMIFGNEELFVIYRGVALYGGTGTMPASRPLTFQNSSVVSGEGQGGKGESNGQRRQGRDHTQQSRFWHSICSIYASCCGVP